MHRARSGKSTNRLLCDKSIRIRRIQPNYLVIFGQVNVRMQEFFEFNNASRTRRHPYKLYKRHSYSSVRTLYCAVRVINVWNALPVDRVDFSSCCI